MDSPAPHRHAPYRYVRRIYYADTDAGGVVYHGAYLAIAEQARTEALRDAGVPHADLLAQHDAQFMVRRVNLEYLRPARLDDMLTVTTAFTGETGATVAAQQSFARTDGAVCVRMDVDLVCVRASTGKPIRIPPRWRLASRQGRGADGKTT
jgi:acyl-CoA thioester hydrolase